MSPIDLLERCVQEQAEHWRRGERVPAESFLARHPELADDDHRVDFLYAEYLLRDAIGEPVAESEYFARFPDLRGRLEALFQLHGRLSPPRTEPTVRTVEPNAPLQNPRFAEYALIGRGGAGTVYRARDLELDRTVAIKLLLPSAREFGGAARLRKEAGAIARLRHPNIVQIFDVGEENGQPYLVLEYVDGGTLADRLKLGVLPIPDAVKLVRDIAAALQSAHDQHIIHRDLKPGNILLKTVKADSSQGSGKPPPPTVAGSPVPPGQTATIPLIADFGLAKQLDDVSLTQSGAMIGTAFYMAPEQTDSGAVGPPADVYALGAILYECLTGRPPYLGDSPLAVLALAAKADPVPPSRLRPGLPRDLEAVVLKCLQVEPARRYATAQILAEDLDRILNNRPTMARPSTIIDRTAKWVRRNPQPAALAAVILVTFLAGLAGVLWQWREAVVAKSDLQKSLSAEAEERRSNERSLYATAIAQAAMNWELGDVAKAVEQLTFALPQPGRDDLRGWEWHYLSRLFHSERRVIPCEYWCNSLARLPGPGQFAAAIGRPRMNAFDTAPADGRVATLALDPIQLQAGPVLPDACVAVAVDETTGTIAWGLRNGVVILTDATGTVRARCDTPVEIASLGFIDGGQQIVVADVKGTARTFDWATGALLRELTIWTETRLRFAISPNQKLIIFAGGLNQVRLYSLPDWENRGDLRTGPPPVSALAIDPAGALAAFGNSDGAVLLWNLAERRETLRFNAHTGPVAAIAFHPTDPILASGSSDGTIRFWNPQTGQRVNSFRGHTAAIRTLAFSADGDTLISGGQDNTIRIWDCRQNARGRHLPSHHRLNAIGVLPGEADLSFRAAHLSGGLTTWRIAPSAPLEKKERKFPLTARRIYPVAYTLFLDQARLLAGLPADDANCVALWNCESGQEVQRFPAGGEIIAIGTDDQQKLLAVASRIDDANCRIQLWRPGTSEPPVVRQIEDNTVRVLAVSRDGRRIAAIGGRDRNDPRNTWLLDDDPAPRHLGIAPQSLGALAFSPDQRSLAVSSGGRIELFDCDSGQRTLTSAIVGGSTCLAFSPDGRRIASVGYEGVVALVDVVSGKLIFQLPGLAPGRPEDQAADARVLFTPDGRTLISTNWDGSINIWNGPR